MQALHLWLLLQCAACLCTCQQLDKETRCEVCDQSAKTQSWGIARSPVSQRTAAVGGHVQHTVPYGIPVNSQPLLVPGGSKLCLQGSRGACKAPTTHRHSDTLIESLQAQLEPASNAGCTAQLAARQAPQATLHALQPIRYKCTVSAGVWKLQAPVSMHMFD